MLLGFELYIRHQKRLAIVLKSLDRDNVNLMPVLDLKSQMSKSKFFIAEFIDHHENAITKVGHFYLDDKCNVKLFHIYANFMCLVEPN